jgi:cysteine-rich repeat protein
LLSFVVAGCLKPEAKDCGGGVVCAEDRRCATVQEITFCVTTDQLDACKDLAEGDACMSDGTCHEGVCLDSVCGNGLMDVGEVCDVAALAEGERCSETCKSNETCGNGVIDTITGELCDDHNNLDHDGCSSACALETVGWHQAAEPAASANVMAAYDAPRGKVVLFDGTTGEVMEWDRIWRRFVVEAPSPRTKFALTYSRDRGGVVLYGGTVGSTQVGDTYVWNGIRWSQLPTGPALDFPAMAYDVATKQLVVFGVGRENSSTAPQTWVLGSDDVWTLITTPTAPPLPNSARAVMAYDAKRGNIVLYDGNTRQTWIFGAGAWTMKSPAVVPQVSRTALAYLPSREHVVMFGGVESAGVSSRTYEWDGTNWALMTSAAGGLPRGDHALAEDGRGRLLAFGGTSSSSSIVPLADTWFFANATWARAEVAPARSGASIASVPTRGSLVRFGGGADLDTPADADTWELGRNGWQKFTDGPASDDSPPPLVLPKMVYDSARDEVVLFGGIQAGSTMDDRTWVRHGTTWTAKHPVPSPPPRVFQSMTYDAARGVTVMTGGSDLSFNLLDDTWLWNGTTWTQVTTPGPSVRTESAMAYDPVAQNVVLYGGLTTNPNTSLDDVWIWDGAWHEVTTSAGLQPAPAEMASFTWDPAGARLLLTGGASRPFDVWAWKGSLQSREWKPVSLLTTPPARSFETVVSSIDGSGISVIGGNALDDWWELRSEGPRGSDVCERRLDGDGDGRTACDDADCWRICAPLCPPGTSCPTGAPTCGDGVCSTIESCTSCPSDCTTSCPALCGDFVCESGEMCPGDCP